MNRSVRIDVWRLEIALEEYRKHPERRMGVVASISGGWFIDKKDQSPKKSSARGFSA